MTQRQTPDCSTELAQLTGQGQSLDVSREVVSYKAKKAEHKGGAEYLLTL